jgi:hypothetical protein
VSFFIRTLAGICLLFAGIALIADLTRSMNEASTSFTTLAGHWRGISAESLKWAQDRVVGIHPALWSQAAGRILSLPTWLTLGGLGLVFGYLGRRQRRANIFINN